MDGQNAMQPVRPDTRLTYDDFLLFPDDGRACSIRLSWRRSGTPSGRRGRRDRTSSRTASPASSRRRGLACRSSPPRTRRAAKFQVEMQRAFEDVDVFVMPTVPITAPPIDSTKVLRNTWPFNAARMPSVSVPCGVDSRGLPIGLQIVGRVGDDATVLRAARAFEPAR